ncbi:MAG: hypothetical protein HZB85_10310 [Deltaproteobacteria bacterium]|nr:hypothetical protein [Deltaproteobacteria bacterium]
MANAVPDNGAGRRPWRRKGRNFLVKRGIQSRFILGFTAVVVAGFALHLFLSYYIIDRQLAGELYRTHLKIRTTADIAGPTLLRIAAVTVAAIVSAAAVFGYYLTHGVELPLHGFVTAVRRAGRGDLTGHIALKKAPGRLSEAFNAAISMLDARFGSIKRSTPVFDEAVARLGVATGRRLHRDSAQAALDEIALERDRVMNELDGLVL